MIKNIKNRLWSNKVMKNLLYLFIGLYKVNWDIWAECYDYGKDKVFFLNKELCQCRHRSYSHRKLSYSHDLSKRIETCIDCTCPDFKVMNNLLWLEYSYERIPKIKDLCLRDFYDYFTAVAKGEKN